MMEREDDPQLWDLLGQMPAVEPSLFFARNVLREIRNQPERRSWLSWLARPAFAVPALTGALALVATLFVIRQANTPASSPPVVAQAQPAPSATVDTPAPTANVPLAPEQVEQSESLTPVAFNDAETADLVLLADADDDDDDVLSL